MLSVCCAYGQVPVQSKKLKWQKEILIDSTSLLSTSIRVLVKTKNGYDSVLVSSHQNSQVYDYSFDFSNSKLTFINSFEDSILVEFQRLVFDFQKSYSLRDTSMIYIKSKGNKEDYFAEESPVKESLFDTGGLKKTGSISRGITFGNQQDLSVNASLNLQLNGLIAPNLNVLASVTDNNLPIQPEGNTSKIQEFDQVFVQLFNDRFKLTAGDFWIYKPQGYFLNYRKRGQGFSGEYFWKKDQSQIIKTQVSTAFSKGKFNRQLIQGVEGNQGPYRLTGADNEPFVIVLSGTERVFIDGKELSRGQENDYVIDYNSSEVRFTAKNMITKDVRIVVEFQYSDQNYARSLVQLAHEATYKKGALWFNVYSEQDAKNQSIQQSLSSEQKLLLSNVGDQILNAQFSSIDSIGFDENLIMYKVIDTLGFDSVLVFSANPSLAKFSAQFTYVGALNGNYKLKEFNGLGRVYVWVQPLGGIPQGDFEPIRLLAAPKQQQLISLGVKHELFKNVSFTTEFATSKTDLNTFSRLNSNDDRGFSNRSKLNYDQSIGVDTAKVWRWKSSLESELLDPFFRPIEQYRTVEFDRDWNTRGKNFKGNQVFLIGETGLVHKTNGNLIIQGQHYKIGDVFSGNRALAKLNWTTKKEKHGGWKIQGDGSYLDAKGIQKNQFLRHRIELVRSFNKFYFGFKDDQESNSFREFDSLLGNSYRFYDWQTFGGFADSSGNGFKLSYRERYDGRLKNQFFSRATRAQTFALEWKQQSWKQHKLTVIAGQRILSVLDTTIINIQAEQTSTGRIDYEYKTKNQFFQLNTFYEVGSGLELRREFIYIQVNDGQGVYTWVDYNFDNVKDLNEFEVAQFADQADYIRVFTPSNAYVRTFSNEYNQSLQLRPDRIFRNSSGFKRVVSKFSSLSRIRIQRKTSAFNGFESYNPFNTRIDEVGLINLSMVNKHTLFFNRSNNVVGADYSFEQNQSKQLLANGFDAKSKRSNEVNARLTIKKTVQLLAQAELGKKTSLVDYTSGRNYEINYWQIKPSIVYQPNTNIRLAFDTRISEKQNSLSFGNEKTNLQQFSVVTKYNTSQKGSLQADLSYIHIEYNGNSNSALAFEMLEALKPGSNFIWSMSLQRSVSRNLQLSIQYNGRKSEGNRTIHAGGMELKAFF
jgi:hypothetical protein